MQKQSLLTSHQQTDLSLVVQGNAHQKKPSRWSPHCAHGSWQKWANAWAPSAWYLQDWGDSGLPISETVSADGSFMLKY